MPRYYVKTLFENLPAGLPKPVLDKLISDFRSGNFEYRNYFIEAHVRLATSVALQYGYVYNRNDELIGVAVEEVCKFPQRVADDHLKDNRAIKYLLSRLHTVCRDYVRNDNVLHVPSSSIVHCGVKRPKRRQFPTHDDADPDPGFFVMDSIDNDVYNDVLACVETEAERLVIKLSLEGRSDVEIASQFGFDSSTPVAKIKARLAKRYYLRTLSDKQTFLPFPDYEKSAQILSDKHLKHTEAVAKEVLDGLLESHPVSKMWRGFEHQLCTYAIEVSCELLDRGIETKLLEQFAKKRNDLPDNGLPYWLGTEILHSSHRAMLNHKDGNYCFSEKPNSIPHWPRL